ncbi:MAG: alpha/beta hydrolase [Deltaproteobacteria bacterium]|nr:alpha/beta hydrolase [Deltaproteobacteria bacterium]
MATTQRFVTERSRGRLSSQVSVTEGKTFSFDKTPIVYRSVGEGNPIICCNGLGVSTFFWVYLERFFKGSYQIVTWDYRGHGHSGLNKNIKNYSVDALVKDLKAVVDRLKIKKAIFTGHSLGVQVILEFYRRYPERVRALIPCLGTYGHPMDTFYNMRLSRYIFQACYWLGIHFPREANLISRFFLNNPASFFLGGILKVMHTGMISHEDCDRYVNHVLAMDPLFFSTLWKSYHEHSTEDVLKKIRVPTLIIAGEDDQFTPVWISKKMSRLIPRSELLIVKKGTHAALVEQPELLNLRIEKFLNERLRLRSRS